MIVVCAVAIDHTSTVGQEERAHCQTIKKQVIVLLVLLKDAKVLVHLLVDIDVVEVANRVFAEEVELNVSGRRESDVLAAQRAAADRIRFFVALLVAGTKRKEVDEVESGGALTVRHELDVEVGSVIATDAINVLLWACQ